MSVHEHYRRQRIINATQHPYKHSLADFAFAHDALPGVNTLSAALQWIFDVLYPRTQEPVANVAALPSVGNTIGDYRIVEDDGDGRAAGYQWQQREGDVAAQWYKIADMDWGVSTIVSQYLLKSQDLYVYRYGYDDTDENGDVYTGDLAGQRIYGGATASTHLLLFANSGDGTGSNTGYIQFGDNVRPLTDSAYTLGTNLYRFSSAYVDQLVSGTMTVAGGSITDSTGAISFDNENLSTTGTITGASLITGTMTLTGGSITDSTGAIDFGNEDLDTTGVITGGFLATGTLLLAGGSITDSSGAISFDNENLTTTGTFQAGAITGTQLNVDDVRIDGSTYSAQTLNSGLVFIANGTGVIDMQSAMTTIGQTVTGTVGITGQLDVDNITVNGNTISSTNTNGYIDLDPNGTGLVRLYSGLVPDITSVYDIGATGAVWNKLWIDGSIGDGVSEISIANLLTFADVGTPSPGHSLFWNGTRWVSSAPDTEIDHGTVSGLGDDDHTQYFLLAGRSGGQTVYGGTAAGDDLTIVSTSNVTLGDIIFGSRLLPSTDDTFDIGSGSNQIQDLYIAGQAYGLRAQNATTAGAPSASASTKGRLYFNTDENDLFVDLGGTWKKISIEKHEFEDAVTWDGATSSKVYTVSSDVSDARKCLWALYSNSDTFEEVQVKITKTQTQVTVTAQTALPAGTYTLIGIG